MLYTVNMIIKQKLLDEYMPQSKTFGSKRMQIYSWIKEGKLSTLEDTKFTTKLIPQEAIQKFKDDIAILIENIIK